MNINSNVQQRSAGLANEAVFGQSGEENAKGMNVNSTPGASTKGLSADSNQPTASGYTPFKRKLFLEKALTDRYKKSEKALTDHYKKYNAKHTMLCTPTPKKNKYEYKYSFSNAEGKIMHMKIEQGSDKSSDVNKKTCSFLLGNREDFNQEECGETCRRDGREIDSFDDNSLSKGEEIKNPIDSLFSDGGIDNNDVDTMVSKLFSIICKEYYERLMKLDELIAADSQEDKLFMEIINSGPMYISDCFRLVKSYNNKFKSHFMVENTVLSDFEKLMNKSCPPMDIYKQKPLMDLVSNSHYIVAKGVNATQALSDLKNKFCLIDCTMTYQIAYYETILFLIGKEKFNKKFNRSAEFPLAVCYDSNEVKVLSHFISKHKIPRNDDKKQWQIPPLTLKKGHVYYFSNHKDYIKKHPRGVDVGFNVMLVNIIKECPYFTCFGLPGEGLNAQDVCNELLESFNCYPDDDYELLGGNLSSEKKKIYDSFKEKTITIEEFYANGAGWNYLGEGSYLDLIKVFREIVTVKLC